MAVNRYTNIEPAKYNPRSLQELMMVPAYKRQQHDALDVSSADLEQKIGELQSLKTDNPIVQAEQQKLKEKLTNQSDVLATKGFTSTSKSDFQKLNSDYQRFMSSTGIGGKASSNYAAYVANEKDLKDLYQNGKISKEKYQLGLQSASDKYSQAGGVASNTTYNPFVASLDQDIDSRARQIALDIQKNPKVLEQFGLEKRGNRYYDVKTEQEYTPEGAINYGIQAILGSDTSVRSDLQQREQLGLLGDKTAGEYLKGVGDIYESLYSVNNIKTTKSGYYDPLEIHRAKKKIDDEYKEKTIPFEKYSLLNIELFNKADIDKLNSVINGVETINTDKYTSRGDASFLSAIYDVITGKADKSPITIDDIDSTLKNKMETIFNGLKLEDPTLEGKDLKDPFVLKQIVKFMESTPQIQIQPKINKIPIAEGVQKAKNLVLDAKSKEFYDPETNETLTYKDMVKKNYLSGDVTSDQAKTFYRGEMQSDHSYTTIMLDSDKAANYAIPEVYIINGKEFLVPNMSSELNSPYYIKELRFNKEFNKLKTTLPQKYEWRHTDILNNIPTVTKEEIKIRLKANNKYTIEYTDGVIEYLTQEDFKDILMESKSK